MTSAKRRKRDLPESADDWVSWRWVGFGAALPLRDRDAAVAQRAGISWLNGLGTQEPPEAVNQRKESLIVGSEASLPSERIREISVIAFSNPR
jgi:hypothetical protein